MIAIFLWVLQMESYDSIANLRTLGCPSISDILRIIRTSSVTEENTEEESPVLSGGDLYPAAVIGNDLANHYK